MYDYKFRQVEPSFPKRKRNSLKPVLLVFLLALALGMALVYAPAWLDWPSFGGGESKDPNIIPLTLPPQTSPATAPG